VKDNKQADLTAYLFFNNVDDADRAATQFAGMSNAQRVVLNRVGPPASPKPIYSYKGIVEVSASDRKNLDAALVAGQKAGVKPDLEVVTRECLLWDNGPVVQQAKSA
jgi:hypothetical protein